MEIVVTGRHTQVKQRFRDVVETKMNRVTAIAPDDNRRIPNLDLHGFARAKIGGDRSLRAVVRLFLRHLRLGLRGDNTQIHRDRVRVTTTVILATVTSTPHAGQAKVP